MSMLVLGDASKRVEAKLPKLYSTSIKSDIVQLAHHVANEMPTIYNTVKAKLAFAPTCVERLTSGNAANQATYARTMEIIRKYATNIYFSGSHDYTVGLAYRNGQITEVYSPKVR
jgi:hypothetical protein